MEIQIKQASVDDLEDILNLNHKLFLYEAFFTNTYNVYWPFSERGKKYFSDRIKDLENAVVLVAKSEGITIGYICGYLDNYSFRTLNPVMKIENMFVEEEFRGKSIGKLLFDEFHIIAKNKGTKLIKVSALFNNTNAIEFYKKCGFQRVEVSLELKI